MADLLMIGLGIDTRRLRDGDRALERLGRTGAGVERTLGRMASLLGGMFAASKIIEYADAYTNLQNRLKLVMDGTESLARATQNVIDIAKNSRQALGATGDLYFKISQAADKLGLSVADVGRVTETFGKTLALSGAGTQQAEAAILQFSQALASGVIRGDEFNSVAENAPAALDALSRSLGVSKGELRKLAQEGRLTADILIQALKEQSDEVDKAFAKTESTISQAFTGLKNSTIVFIGQLNEATESSKGLVSTLEGLSQWLDSGALFDDIIYQTKIWGYALDDVKDAVNILDSELKEMGVDGNSIMDKIGKSLKTLPTDFTALVKIAGAEWTHFRDMVAEGLIIHSDRRKEIDDAYKQSITNILGERDARLSASAAAVKAIQDERKARKQSIADKELSDYMDMLAKPAMPTAKDMLANTKGKPKHEKKTQAEKDAEHLQKAYESLHDSQRETIALYGKETEVAKVTYATTSGELSKLSSEKKAALLADAARIDAQNKHIAEEEQAAATMQGQAQEISQLQSFFMTKEQMAQESYERRAMQIRRYNETFAGVEAEAAALSLENEKQLSLEKQQIAIEQYDFDVSMKQQSLSAASDFAGNILNLAKATGHENNEIAKIAFAGQKVIAIAQTILSAEQAAIATQASYATLAALTANPALVGAGTAHAAFIRGMGYASAGVMGALAVTEASGARAMGGQVQAGGQYLVGERGPEVITMGGAGMVTPNHKLGSKITIVNQTMGKIDSVTEKTMPDGERVLIIQESVKQARDLVAAEMRDPNSKTRKSMGAGLQLQARR